MKTNYIPSVLAEGYFYDKAVFEKHLRGVNHRKLIDQAKTYRDTLKPLLDEKESFSKTISLQGKDYIISFLSIKNFKDCTGHYSFNNRKININQ